MELERLKSKLRALAKKELRGRALLAEGRKSSRRKSRLSGRAFLAEGRKSSRHKSRMSGRAILAEGKRRKSRRLTGKAVLAGKKHKSMKSHRGANALTEINAIARKLKRQHPRMEHKEAISQASKIYRGEGKRHTRKAGSFLDRYANFVRGR